MFTKTLLPDTFRAIKLVSDFPEIQKAYLAGGTALALKIGHRISAVLEDHLYSILRSLDYFEDAEEEKQMPRMVTKVGWEEVKDYFQKETRLLTKKKLQAP